MFLELWNTETRAVVAIVHNHLAMVRGVPDMLVWDSELTFLSLTVFPTISRPILSIRFQGFNKYQDSL